VLIKAKLIFLTALAVTALAWTGCGSGNNNIILATTTSVQDTGFLDKVIPLFESAQGYNVKVIAVGSGQALAMGRRGEADLLLVHSPDDEEKFVKEGCGISRRPLMFNFFVILGPADDPAGVSKAGFPTNAFRFIYEKRAPFVSRGDNSGTHQREKKLWQVTGIFAPGQSPDYPGYIQTGQGMSETITIADQKKAYTLSDYGTYLARKDKISLKPVFNEPSQPTDSSLINIYSVIELNPERFAKINATGAKALAGFLASKEVAEIIRNYGRNKYGEPMFSIIK